MVDFIVVGAGSAGAVVAARLAEAQAKVLLVEAGGDPPEESAMPGLFAELPQTKHDWNYTNKVQDCYYQCLRSRNMNLTCGRVLGGGSSIDHMIYLRGCPGDFIPWVSAAKDSTWNWKGVLPYYIKSEKQLERNIINSPQGKYHGTEGFLGVSQQRGVGIENYLESFKELGNDIIRDLNADKYTGYNYPPMYTISNGVRQSTEETILAKQKNNPHLHILKDTLATKIIFDKNNNAIGIEAIIGKDKAIKFRARKEVIISAGALNSPGLLMRSGIGPETHLQSLNIPVRCNLPVGKNLQDHLAVMIPIKLEESTDPQSAPDPRKFPFDMFLGSVALNKSKCCPDYQTVNLIIPNGSRSIFGLCERVFGYDHRICQKIYEAGLNRRVMYTMLDILHPESRGQVQLRSINPRDMPLIDVGYLRDNRDLETIVDSLVDFVKILNTQYFKSIKGEMVNFELSMCKHLPYMCREWWRCYVRCMMNTFYHYAGTCALGSVVDSRLRVFGVNRLRVVDASIMPKLIGSKISAACIMIAEKAAEFIKGTYKL